MCEPTWFVTKGLGWHGSVLPSGLFMIIEVLFKFGSMVSVHHRGQVPVMANSSESEDKRRFFPVLYAKKSLK